MRPTTLIRSLYDIFVTPVDAPSAFLPRSQLPVRGARCCFYRWFNGRGSLPGEVASAIAITDISDSVRALSWRCDAHAQMGADACAARAAGAGGGVPADK